MGAITSSNNPVRHVVGDFALRHFDLSGNNGDTFTVPFPQNVAQVDITPTTAIAVGATRNANVITFVTLGAWAARITVWTRVG